MREVHEEVEKLHHHEVKLKDPAKSEVKSWRVSPAAAWRVDWMQVFGLIGSRRQVTDCWLFTPLHGEISTWQTHQHVKHTWTLISLITIWAKVDRQKQSVHKSSVSCQTFQRPLMSRCKYVGRCCQQWGGNRLMCWAQLQFTDSVCLHMCPASLLPAVKRPVLISGCPGLSQPLTRRQHNDDVTDCPAGHPGAPCSGWDSLLKTWLQDATRFSTMMLCSDGETLKQAALSFFHPFSMFKKWSSSVWMLIIFLQTGFVSISLLLFFIFSRFIRTNHPDSVSWISLCSSRTNCLHHM